MKKIQFTKLALSLSCIGLAIVILATSFAFVRFKKTKIDVGTSTTPTTEQKAETTTTETTTTAEVESSSTVAEATSSKIVETEESTTKSAETSSNKKTPAQNSKPSDSSSVKTVAKSETTTTTKPTVTECNHTWTEWKSIRLWGQERTCSKCGWIEERELDNRNDFMGNKSEYLELLGYINEARREAGYHELVYKSEWQAGADQRAKDLTQKFSHTRPDGRRASTAYSDLGYDVWGFAECCASGPRTAKEVFNGFKNSPKHWDILVSSADNDKIVISRCNYCWVVNVVD